MAKVNPVQLQKYLKGLDYPATTENLIAKAEENGADDNICSMLAQLPQKEFEFPTDVNKELGDTE